MNEFDCVEVIVEKDKYVREGVHKGMQGWICFEQRTPGRWLVNFPQYGEKNDIATLDIKEDDLCLLPDGMDARVNERIKAQFDNIGNEAKEFRDNSDDLSGYLI